VTVYVLRSDNLVKIGFTDDICKRVQSIVAAVPVPVEFVGHMPGDRKVETHLHSIFAAHHFSGEWFVETPEMHAVFALLLVTDLPKLLSKRRAHKRRSDNDIEAARELIRATAADRYPRLTHQKRIDEVATALGWNRCRVRDLYYADPRAIVRAYEAAELTTWATPSAVAGKKAEG
jgi:hypothetical protein